MKYTTKQTLKTIIAAVLGVVIVGGAIGLIASLSKKSDDGLKKINPTFSVGGLTDTGKYEETKYSIYTKESFACQGLKVEVDFDSNITYQAYFYDTNDNFVSATEIYEEGNTFSVPYGVEYARLEVTPIWEKGTSEKDKELGYFDTFKYGGQLTVKVAEDQTSVELGENLYLYEGRGTFVSTKYTASETGFYCSKGINCSEYSMLYIFIPSADFNSNSPIYSQFWNGTNFVYDVLGDSTFVGTSKEFSVFKIDCGANGYKSFSFSTVRQSQIPQVYGIF